MKIGVFVSGKSWGDVRPEALDRGLGGRETAAVKLAMEWANAGHEVHVFAQNEGALHDSFESGGSLSFVDTAYASSLLTAYPFDVVLSWEEPGLFALPQIKQWGAVTVCGMQVAHVHDRADVLALPDLWVALSPWHAEFLGAQLPCDLRTTVLPNCVDLDRYARAPRTLPRDRAGLRFLYASSPDRGLHHVLDAWPTLRKRFPAAELHLCYGARAWAESVKWSHYQVGDLAAKVLRGLAQPGVIDHGRIGQQQLAELHYASDFLLYPCDTMVPTETGCITVMEGLAAGDLPIISDADCLPSEFGDYCPVLPLPFEADVWADAIAELAADPLRVVEMRAAGRAWIERERTWSVVAPRWIEAFEALRAEVFATA